MKSKTDTKANESNKRSVKLNENEKTVVRQREIEQKKVKLLKHDTELKDEIRGRRTEEKVLDTSHDQQKDEIRGRRREEKVLDTSHDQQKKFQDDVTAFEQNPKLNGKSRKRKMDKSDNRINGKTLTENVSDKEETVKVKSTIKSSDVNGKTIKEDTKSVARRKNVKTLKTTEKGKGRAKNSKTQKTADGDISDKVNDVDKRQYGKRKSNKNESKVGSLKNDSRKVEHKVTKQSENSIIREYADSEKNDKCKKANSWSKKLEKKHKHSSIGKNSDEVDSGSTQVTVDLKSSADRLASDTGKVSNKESDVEFMSSDSDSSDSESETCFEPENKKIKLSPDIEQKQRKNKDQHKNVKNVNEKMLKQSDKLKSKTPSSKCSQNIVEYTPKTKKLKFSKDEINSSKNKKSAIQETTCDQKISCKSDKKNVKLKQSQETGNKNEKHCRVKKSTENQTSVKKSHEKNSSVKKLHEKDSAKRKPHSKLSSVKKSHGKHSPSKKSNQDVLSKIDHTDVMAVLLHMEGGNSVTKPGTSKTEPDTFEDDSEEAEDSDWEEVEDHPSQKSPVKSQISKEPIEITLDAPEIVKKRKKKQFDWAAYVQRQMNRFKRELREDIHKVHLMCLMARGMYLNRICNHVEIQAVALSLVQEEYMSKSKRLYHTNVLHRLLKWMKSTIIIDEDLGTNGKNMVVTLTKRLEKKQAASMLEFVMLFVILLRSLGLDVRLVMSLQPLSMKDTSSKKSPEDKTKSRKPTKHSAKTSQNHGKEKHDSEKYKQSEKQSKKQILKEEKYKTTKGQKDGNVNDITDEKQSVQSRKYQTKNNTLRSRASKIKPGTYKEDEGEADTDDEIEPNENDESEEDEQEYRKLKKKRKSTGKKSKYFKHSQENVESDFEEDKTVYRTPTLKKKLEVLSNRKILSESEDSLQAAEENTEQGCDQWVEVYVEAEQKWICFDCNKGQMNKPYEIESRATQPVHYVVAYDNEGNIKDVTSRYASKWMTDTRKLRVNTEWWEETLDPYVTYNKTADEKEDEQIKSNLISRPMPTSISAFKSHPLYVLTRHLLKFEAIYPESAVPLGYIRGEPIYARECVHVLHSRENWLKEGRAVRIGEEAYKMVKSRPKWRQPKENPDALDLECFGIWQTEKYMPPPVVDGKIPRNAYGNLELFKPWMLPVGTVHLQVPGLNKVAKKLNMDCVPAMVGWDTHCGFSHPLLDGFIVCEEDKDILLAAWDEDQEIQKQRETEKREKRVYGNWKLLIKGLLIRERLQKRYDLDSKNEENDINGKDAEKALDYEMSWPRKQQEQEKQNKKSGSKHFKVESL